MTLEEALKVIDNNTSVDPTKAVSVVEHPATTEQNTTPPLIMYKGERVQDFLLRAKAQLSNNEVSKDSPILVKDGSLLWELQQITAVNGTILVSHVAPPEIEGGR